LKAVQLLIIVVSVLMTVNGFCEETSLETGTNAYYTAKYNDAIKILTELVQSDNNLSDMDLSKCHKYIALSYIGLNDPEMAQAHFIKTLEHNPDFDYDRNRTSPKILNVFIPAKEQWLAAQTPVDEPDKDVLKKRNRFDTATLNKTHLGWGLIGAGGGLIVTGAGLYGASWGKVEEHNQEESEDAKDKRAKKY